MRLLSLILGIAAILIISSDHATADLVVNGGFETGDFTGWNLSGDPSNNVVDTGFPHSGLYNAAFGESGDLGSLAQTLATDIGSSYTLSFWFAGNGDTPSEFTASVGGQLLLDLQNPPTDGTYHQYIYQFTATSTATPLLFGFRDDSYFIYLDDVSVVPDAAITVPEPTSIMSLGMGIALTVSFYTCHRKRRQ